MKLKTTPIFSELLASEENIKIETLSADAESTLRQHVTVGLAVSFYHYNVYKGAEKAQAMEHCLALLSDMVEDGRCSYAEIESFKKEIGENRPTCAIISTGQIALPHQVTEIDALLSFCAQPDIELTEAEREAVDKFNASLEQYRQATDNVLKLLRGHIRTHVRALLDEYSGFDEGFAKQFETF